jgi:hypothetical protein
MAERVDCRGALWGVVNVPVAEYLASISTIVLPVVVLLDVIVALDARLRSSSLDGFVLANELRNVHLGLRLGYHSTQCYQLVSPAAEETLSWQR